LLKTNYFFITVSYAACTPRALKDSGNQILKGGEEEGGMCPGKASSVFVSLDILLPATLALTRLVTRAGQGDGPVAQTAASKSREDSYQGDGEKYKVYLQQFKASN
jgi:hypothetical protein